ncbi:hypothetical protein IAQ61_001172 [Plenodomus lingam]|nr:hypothetical protein IAQ61_001172 [Plenodomus lingam]
MPKALHFKGDKKVKKRRKAADPYNADAAPSKQVSTSAPAATEDDDSWVSADTPSDVSGPIVVVLPTDAPTCLACDAHGKVFASALENIVDGDSSTAEPHDVRQVFIANRVAGTENLSLKGHHGRYIAGQRPRLQAAFSANKTTNRYMSCDKFGILSATATAISPEESFLLIPIPDNPSAFSLQTPRDKFLAISDSSMSTPDIRGDAEDITFNTTFRIRMQARFKPRLKASKEEKAKEKISKRELEDLIGRKLNDDEVKKLRRSRREGNYHEVALDMKVKSSHDKYASM